MKYSSFLNFENCSLDNNLWNQLINNVGMQKAQQAIKQSKDLQLMQGSDYTLPILFADTCGSALVNVDLVKMFIGIIAIRLRGIK